MVQRCKFSIELKNFPPDLSGEPVKGNNEVVMHGFNGYLFHTIEEGIGYIEKLHKDRVLSERMSRFSRTFYEDNFTINKMIDALVSVYDKLNFL